LNQCKIRKSKHIPGQSACKENLRKYFITGTEIFIAAIVTPIFYAGVFPESAAEFEQLSAAVERLILNDSSVTVFRENSAALGAGYRCG